MRKRHTVERWWLNKDPGGGDGSAGTAIILHHTGTFLGRLRMGATVRPTGRKGRYRAKCFWCGHEVELLGRDAPERHSAELRARARERGPGAGEGPGREGGALRALAARGRAGEAAVSGDNLRLTAVAAMLVVLWMAGMWVLSW